MWWCGGLVVVMVVVTDQESSQLFATWVKYGTCKTCNVGQQCLIWGTRNWQTVYDVECERERSYYLWPKVLYLRIRLFTVHDVQAIQLFAYTQWLVKRYCNWFQKRFSPVLSFIHDNCRRRRRQCLWSKKIHVEQICSTWFFCLCSEQHCLSCGTKLLHMTRNFVPHYILCSQCIIFHVQSENCST